MGLKVLACVCLLTLAQRGYVTLADDSDLTYPLDGIKEFRIEHEGAGECIDDEAKLSPCEENKHRNLWKWEQQKLVNVQSKKCLIYVHEGNVTVGDCSLSSKKVFANTWRCDKTKIFANRKGNYGLRTNGDGKINAVVDDGKSTPKNQRASGFNIYINSPTRPKLMICALWYDMGNRTNDPRYYFFKNSDFEITWPTKYVKFYVIFGRPMYQIMLKIHGSNVDAAIQEAILGGVSALDKEYRRINIRLLLTGYEVWKDHSPINDSRVYNIEKAQVRNYSFSYLRSKYDYDSCIYARGGGWIDGNGKKLNLGGAGMSDLCKLNKTRLSTEMFIMASAINSQQRFSNLISHEFGHQVFQGHNFEPGKHCPFYRMFGTKCTMGGNDEPKGFSQNYFKALQSKEKLNATSCVNKKPNLQKIQNPKMCGNGIRDPGEECDCGSSQACLTSNPCCDGMICRLRPGAECSNEKCCSNCKIRTTGKKCRGSTTILSNQSGTISSRAREYNSHRHWKIVAKPGQQIVLYFRNLWFDFHINCSYDYIEVRDGADKNSKLIGKYCNQAKLPPYILSSSNGLFITFHADMTFSSKFQINYFALSMNDNDRKGPFKIGMQNSFSGNKLNICENKSKRIKCAVGKSITFMNARYGSLNTAACGGSGNSSTPSICVEANSENITKKLCEGKRICYLRANSKIFGNKCSGAPKSLEATYYCKENVELKKCLAYDDNRKNLVIRTNATCTDQFQWLDNNILYHVGSKRCLNSQFKMTYNCYSASNAQFKLENGHIRNGENCWKVLKQGVVGAGSCAQSSAVFYFQ